MLVEKKKTLAAWPRGTASTVHPSDRLELAYLKFSNEEPIPPKTTVFNFVFAHGTGMNKSIWRVHIEELFKRSKNEAWTIGAVVSVDAAGHGDSGLLNKGKLSWAYDWRDGGKDLIEVVKHEAATTGDFAPSAYTRNILVGHSMGGFQVTYAAALEPTLFDSCIGVEAVIYYDPVLKDFFLSRVRKLEHILLDEFPDKEAVDVFFKEQSFYKVLEPRALEAFLADEVYEKDGKFYTKTTNRAQMSVYLSAIFFVEYGMDIVSQMQIPYLLLTADAAQWNHPQSLPFMREHIPDQLFLHGEIEGDHLCHAGNVDGTVDQILAFVQKREAFLSENRHLFPEVKYADKLQQMVDEMFRHVKAGDIGEAYWYDRPKPKI